MEDILELILSILFMPFKSKYDNFKIRHKENPENHCSFGVFECF